MTIIEDENGITVMNGLGELAHEKAYVPLDEAEAIVAECTAMPLEGSAPVFEAGAWIASRADELP